MGALRGFEQRLEAAVSGVFARAFRSAVQPVEIAAALQREADNNTQILSRQRRLVPNEYRVELSQTDLDRMAPYDSALIAELTDQLRDHAQEQGYVFPGPVVIGFVAADDLTTGRFRVLGRARAEVVSRDRTLHHQATAYLDVNGTRHPLPPPSTVVGRGSDADVRINDPGISRRHVEFLVGLAPMTQTGGAGYRAAVPAISVRDLGSTNGMLVNGERVGHAHLGDGDTVRIGNTTLTVRVVQGSPGV